MKKSIYFSIIALTSLILLTAANDERYYKISQVFDIFTAAFRELNYNYVVELDADELLKKGIEGMTSGLDPYTEFYSEDDTGDLDRITYGNYVGFGISTRMIGGRTTIVDIADDWMARDSGLMIGDVLYKIDTANVEFISQDDLSEHTMGEENSPADVQIIRDNDTLDLTLNRHKVNIDNVPYYGMLGEYGYIKLDHFSRGSAQEVKSALLELKSKGMKGLIFDLRNNPGGLLHSAYQICELFVPKGSTIVSTKGRLDQRDFNKKISYSDPIDSTTPMIVLINRYSASASEIIAGCMQDLDRAMIVGQQSFGKGLVQSVIDLPHNTKLKITSAKYYTPSGRCIQRVDYTGKTETKLDTNIFYTKSGREVLENIGITPDSTIEKGYYSSLVYDLMMDDHIFKFSNSFSYQNENIDPQFTVSDSLFDEFHNYLNTQSYDYDNQTKAYIDKLDSLSSEMDNYSSIHNLLDSLDNMMLSDNRNKFSRNSDEIKEVLKGEIMNRYFNTNTQIKLALQQDSTVIKSKDLLRNKVFESILSNAKENQNKY